MDEKAAKYLQKVGYYRIWSYTCLQYAGVSFVNVFMKMYRKVEAEHADYTKCLKEWEYRYGVKCVEG